MLVSIIIPCYNPSGHLLQAVASARSQRHPEIEIILVNDGTEDTASLAILEQAAYRVDRCVHQPNRGLAAARNTGFHVARGDFAVPLDADDLLQPSFVAECVNALQGAPQAAFAYTDRRVFGTRTFTERLGEYNLYTLLYRNNLSYAALIRKEAWEIAGGYDEAMRNGYEDWEFWLRLGARNHFGKYLPRPLFHYRRCGSSLYDVALEHHRQLVAYIRQRHPELYDAAAVARIKARWAPAVCIVSREAPTVQTIKDTQVLLPDDPRRLLRRSDAPAFLFPVPTGMAENAAEMAALATWSGHAYFKLPDGSTVLSRRGAGAVMRLKRLAGAAPPVRTPASHPPLLGNLHRHLVNAELLSWQSWKKHPLRCAGRLIPLRVKEWVNHHARRPVFDVSFYLQFQPNALKLGNRLVEPLRYCPLLSRGRARLAVIIPHLGPGGAESVLLDMLSTLDRSRVEILLLATKSSDNRWLARWRAKVEHIYDLATVVPLERMVPAVYSIISNWACDTVLVQNSLYGYAALPELKRASPSTRTLDVIHGIDQNWDQISAIAEIAHDIDLRIAISALVHRRLLASGTPPEGIRLIHAGVDLERFCSGPPHGGADIKQILFAGRLDSAKRVLTLAEIASHLSSIRTSRDFRFVIAGDGPDLSKLRNRVRRAGLDNVFELRGYVDDTAPLFAESDVVVLPSRAEGIPLVLLEGLASNRPVVASNVGAISEVLDSTCGVLIEVAAGEARAFALALDRLLDDPELRQRMGAAGRRKIELGYDLRRNERIYAELFETSVGHAQTTVANTLNMSSNQHT